MGYTFMVSWTEEHKLFGSVEKSFRTTEDMVRKHLYNLLQKSGTSNIGIRKIEEKK